MIQHTHPVNRVSVIIPTFNRLRLLPKTLDSVLNQNPPPHEILVIDDGSTDGTLEYLRNLDHSVICLEQKNMGPGAARNAAAARATGEYLAFLDSDDLWFPWSLQTYTALIDRYNNPAFLSGKPAIFSEESDLIRISNKSPHADFFPDYFASSASWRWWSTSSFVIRKDVFLSTHGFTNKRINGEDADLTLKLGISPGFVAINEPATFAYRSHAISEMKDFARTLQGAWHLVSSEQIGNYPGGTMRHLERLRILSRHIRPVTLEGLKRGERKSCVQLYLSTILWNVMLRRWRYIFGFPFFFLKSLFVQLVPNPRKGST